MLVNKLSSIPPYRLEATLQPTELARVSRVIIGEFPEKTEDVG